MSLLYHMKNLTYLRVSDHLDSKSTDNFSSLVLSSAWASIILASYRFCNLSNSTCKQLTHKHLTHLIISNKFHIFIFENILLVSFWGHSFFLHCKNFICFVLVLWINSFHIFTQLISTELLTLRFAALVLDVRSSSLVFSSSDLRRWEASFKLLIWLEADPRPLSLSLTIFSSRWTCWYTISS